MAIVAYKVGDRFYGALIALAASAKLSMHFESFSVS